MLGIPIDRLDQTEALRRIEDLYERGDHHGVYYVNAHVLNLAYEDRDYAQVLMRASLLMNDGAGVSLAARLHGARFPINLNGTDFNPQILRHAAAKGWSVFLLGSRPGIAERAAERLEASIPGLSISGTASGYFDPSRALDVARSVRAAGTDVVMAGMGNPLQERWLDRYLADTGARVGIAVGAFFNFAAGVERRAPVWLNRAGLEWAYRLAHDPRRLWRRYLLGNPRFIRRVVQQRFNRDVFVGSTRERP